MVVLKITWIKQGDGGDAWVVQSIKHPAGSGHDLRSPIWGSGYWGQAQSAVLLRLSLPLPLTLHILTQTHTCSLSLSQTNK